MDLSYEVVSSTPQAGIQLTTLVVIGTDGKIQLSYTGMAMITLLVQLLLT
jgi:succinyl-CoA synthetase alpha subunit